MVFLVFSKLGFEMGQPSVGPNVEGFRVVVKCLLMMKELQAKRLPRLGKKKGTENCNLTSRPCGSITVVNRHK